MYTPCTWEWLHYCVQTLYMYMGMATVLCTNTLHVHGDGYSTVYKLSICTWGWLQYCVQTLYMYMGMYTVHRINTGTHPKNCMYASSKDAHAHVCLTLPAVDQRRNHSCPLHTFPVALCKTLLPVFCTVKAKIIASHIIAYIFHIHIRVLMLLIARGLMMTCVRTPHAAYLLQLCLGPFSLISPLCHF